MASSTWRRRGREKSEAKTANRILPRRLLQPGLENRAAVLSRVRQLLFDPQQLVVLGDPIGARGGACLDLARRKTDGQVGDSRVLGFTAAVAGDGRVSVA